MCKCNECIFDSRVYCDGRAFESCEECHHYDPTVERETHLDIWHIGSPNDGIIECVVDDESGRVLYII